MKNYKFTINGNKYSVEVGDIEDNTVNVEVNGTPYKVELETEITTRVKPVVKVAAPAAKSAPAAAPANVKNAPAAATAAGATLKSPLPPRSYEDGEQHRR